MKRLVALLCCLSVLSFVSSDVEAGLISKAVKAKLLIKTYQTYKKTHPKTGKIYTGRTGGSKSPAENILKRDQKHHRDKDGFGPAEIDKTSPSKDAIRGREQQEIE